MSKSTDYLLKVGEVAHRLAVSPRMVYNLIAQGKLKSLKVGRCTRIRESSLDRFIAGSSGEAASR